MRYPFTKEQQEINRDWLEKNKTLNYKSDTYWKKKMRMVLLEAFNRAGWSKKRAIHETTLIINSLV